MSVLELLLDAGLEADYGLFEHALARGDLPCIELLHSQLAGDLTDADISAAKHGHVDVLGWLSSQGHVQNLVLVMCAALQEGHRAVLEWALQQPNGANSLAKVRKRLLRFAAKSGDLAFYQYCQERFKVNNNNYAALSTVAVKAPHSSLLEWLVQNGHFEFNSEDDLLDAAVKAGRLENLRVVYEAGQEWWSPNSLLRTAIDCSDEFDTEAIIEYILEQEDTAVTKSVQRSLMEKAGRKAAGYCVKQLSQHSFLWPIVLGTGTSPGCRWTAANVAYARTQGCTSGVMQADKSIERFLYADGSAPAEVVDRPRTEADRLATWW